ncbi:MAG: trans-sulfuration enzyme family protein [Acidimicrobiia bacterium]
MAPPKERHRMKTLAVHAGEDPDPVTGAAVPNLVMSTSFVVDEPVAFSALDMGEDPPFFYTRWDNPTLRQLATKLAALEGAEAAEVYASGMAATSAILFGVLGAGDHVVMSDTMYAGTAELGRHTLSRFDIESSFVDTSNLDQLADATRSQTRLVWIETPANPILRLTDIAGAAEIAHQAGAELVVDSTFATPVATRPLELGADYVLHSLTKYIGGHGDALGGAVLGSKEALSHLNVEATIHFGGSLSPFNAWLIMRGMATLPLRMEAHQSNALEVARYLETSPSVKAVTYPGLESHPQHDLAHRQMENFGGMLTFQVPDGESMAERMRKELEVFHFAVSLGHHRSLIYWMSTSAMMATSFKLTGEQLASYRALAGDGVFRTSVGLEDPADLIEDLERVL